MKSKVKAEAIILVLEFTEDEVRELISAISSLYAYTEGETSWSWPNLATANLQSKLVEFSNNNLNKENAIVKYRDR